MRCVNLFIRNIKKASVKKTRKYSACAAGHCFLFALLTVIGFFSFPITTLADDDLSVDATHLIQTYMQKNPIDVNALQQALLQQIASLSQLSESDIQSMIQSPQQMDLSIYPVKSLNLTPGTVNTQTIDVQLPQPIFLVGDDEPSRKWIKTYALKLEQLHAQGFVVNIENENDMENLRQLAPNLSFYPMPGDALAEWLHLQHYPVLISDHLIEQ